MDLVEPKNSLADHININTVKNTIVTWIQSIPNYEALKNDVELIKITAKKLQNCVTVKNHDLPQSILDIFSTVFNLSDVEKNMLLKVIQFLVDNELAKPSSTIKKMKFSLTNYVKKKAS
jgi:hypothetical protein